MLIIKRHCLRVVKKPQRLRYGFPPWIGELTVRLNVNSMATSIRRFRPLFKGTGFNVACQAINIWNASLQRRPLFNVQTPKDLLRPSHRVEALASYRSNKRLDCLESTGQLLGFLLAISIVKNDND